MQSSGADAVGLISALHPPADLLSQWKTPFPSPEQRQPSPVQNCETTAKATRLKSANASNVLKHHFFWQGRTRRRRLEHTQPRGSVDCSSGLGCAFPFCSTNSQFSSSNELPACVGPWYMRQLLINCTCCSETRRKQKVKKTLQVNPLITNLEGTARSGLPIFSKGMWKLKGLLSLARVSQAWEWHSVTGFVFLHTATRPLFRLHAISPFFFF